MEAEIDNDGNRSILSKLLQVKTSKSDGKFISLADYISGMKESQKDIYFIAGASLKQVEESPFMEKFVEKDLEVVYTTEPADEYMVERLREFDGKNITTITKESVDFNESDEDKDLQKRVHVAYTDKFKPLVTFLNKFIWVL